MRHFAKHILANVRRLRFLKEARRSIRQVNRDIHDREKEIRRSLQREERNRLLIERYFSTHEIRKLQIGCGQNPIEDWLNSDNSPISDDIFYLDATKTFPFDNEVFDYIFCEHMIEHISYPNGLAMLYECHRVLKDAGTIRISTPDLQFLIDLYRTDKSELQIEYIKWAAQVSETVPHPDDTFVINNFVRDWGHSFIYDEKTLRSSLERAGFTDIVKCELNDSVHEALRHLANEERMPGGFLKLETFTLEGTKHTR